MIRIDKNSIVIEKKFPNTPIKNPERPFPKIPERSIHRALENIVPKKKVKAEIQILVAIK